MTAVQVVAAAHDVPAWLLLHLLAPTAQEHHADWADCLCMQQVQQPRRLPELLEVLPGPLQLRRAVPLQLRRAVPPQLPTSATFESDDGWLPAHNKQL